MTNNKKEAYTKLTSIKQLIEYMCKGDYNDKQFLFFEAIKQIAHDHIELDERLRQLETTQEQIDALEPKLNVPKAHLALLSIYLGNDLVSTIPMPTEDQLVVIDPRLSISYVHYSMLIERASDETKK